jgi:hypothetical protein
MEDAYSGHVVIKKLRLAEKKVIKAAIKATV